MSFADAPNPLELELDYEAQRAATIKANQALLESLGLAKEPKISRTPSSRRTVRADALPTRRSARTVSSASATPTPTPLRAARAVQVRGPAQAPLSRPRDGRFVVRDELQRVYQGSVAGRVHDPKQFGSIPGVEVGRCWDQRAGASRDAIHAPLVAGISGNAEEGAWSVCFAAGYEDNIDEGERFTLVGAGGRDLRGTKAAPKNLRTAPQTSDQSLQHGMNAALARSAETGKPIRVCRGFKTDSPYAPLEGYRYDGLYVVERAWLEKSVRTGYKICKFRFKRLPGQPRIPLRTDNVLGPTQDTDIANSDTASRDTPALITPPLSIGSLASSQRSVSVEVPSPMRSGAVESKRTGLRSGAVESKSKRTSRRSAAIESKRSSRLRPGAGTSRFWYYEEITD